MQWELDVSDFGISKWLEVITMWARVEKHKE